LATLKKKKEGTQVNENEKTLCHWGGKVNEAKISRKPELWGVRKEVSRELAVYAPRAGHTQKVLEEAGEGGEKTGGTIRVLGHQQNGGS